MSHNSKENLINSRFSRPDNTVQTFKIGIVSLGRFFRGVILNVGRPVNTVSAKIVAQ